MSHEMNRIAAKFLNEYLQQNPTEKFSPVCCHKQTPDVDYSHEVAAKFLEQFQDSVEPERIEVIEPTAVIILRVCEKRRPVQPAFLAGFRRQDNRPIWCYDSRLACVVVLDEAEQIVNALKNHGFEIYTLPAPEPDRGSL
jgi:hypothetical protein